jgi:5'-deoxynucleotidase YfbR-like HD superfamily hydrolase
MIESAIASHLPANLQEEYASALTPDQIDVFEKAYGDVWRFESLDLLRLLKGDFRESDLDHVNGILDLVDWAEHDLPEVTSSMNLDDVRIMVILHDIGEMYTGDVPSHGDVRLTSVSQRKKNMEPRCAIWIIRNLHDPQIRARALELFDRYEKQADPEAVFAKFLDKLQGDNTAVTHVFNYKEKDEELDFSLEELSEHVAGSLDKLVSRAIALQSHLPATARVEITHVVQSMIERFRGIGFPSQADTYSALYEREMKYL